MIARSLMIGVAGAALMVSGAQAADLYVPETPVPVYEDVGLEGLYIGVVGSGVYANDEGYGAIGGVIGVNFAVSDPIVVALEAELDAVFGDDAPPGGGGGGDLEVFGNFAVRAHLGALVTDDVMIYALAGVGVLFGDDLPGALPDPTGYGEIGAGVEFGVSDNISIRAEGAYLMSFDGDAAGRASVGLLWHL